MRVGIFSKLGASGGSEHRCAEMANAIVRHTGSSATILCEEKLNKHIEAKLDPEVEVVKHIFKPASKANPDAIYGYDTLLVINSDSYSFARLEYWHGTLKDKKTGEIKHHEFDIDLSKMPQIVFLFNFVVSPAQWLESIADECDDVRIVVANNEFWYQLEYKDKLKKVKKLPRLFLESPIDPGQITIDKIPSDKIRIGKHSKAHGYKHNEEWPKLIHLVNKKYGERVEWDLLGVPDQYVDGIQDFTNVTIREEYSIPVGEYLKGIDIFCFFIAWRRQEPWARCMAEAMMSGCPVLATNKAGNRDQVMNGINGFLCGNVEEFADRIGYLIDNPVTVNRMRENNIIAARHFTPDQVINRFMEFIRKDHG